MKLLSACIIALLCITSAHAEKPNHTYSYQKPGAAISLLDPEFIQMDPNSERTVTITFQTPSSGELTITAKPSSGISIDDGNEHRFDLSTETASLTLTINAQAQGQHHIMFHASISQQESSMRRVFGLAVQVGAAAVASKQKSSSPYVIMQAEETIK